MSGDTRHIQHVELTFTYSEELSENELPRPGKPGIVVVQEGYARVKRWHIKRVFYFLTCSSALCLTAVALFPKPAVQATAFGILTTSAGLAQFLLAGVYRKPGERKPPKE
jgi:hypothetical protein